MSGGTATSGRPPRSSFRPSTEAETTGNAVVAWYDCRNDLGNGLPGDTNGVANDDAMMYAALSRDGGVTFGSNVRVAAAASNSADSHWSLDFGDYEGLAVTGATLQDFLAFYVRSYNTPADPLNRSDVFSVRINH